jgi:hypothetical protein
MWDRDGIYYRFGGTTDSEQYYTEGATKKYYRWDLSLIEDTHGNQATVTYVRDIHNSSVRSAYPEYLKYNSNLIQVHFSSSYDETDPTDGNLRYDNPKSTGSNPAPKVMENRKLDYVEIKVNGSLTRKYTFAYNTTFRYYSSDYGGIYYSAPSCRQCLSPIKTRKSTCAKARLPYTLETPAIRHP